MLLAKSLPLSPRATVCRQMLFEEVRDLLAGGGGRKQGLMSSNTSFESCTMSSDE